MDAMDRQIDPAIQRRRLIRRIAFPAAALVTTLVLIALGVVAAGVLAHWATLMVAKLVALVVMMVATAILWGYGFAPQFVD